LVIKRHFWTRFKNGCGFGKIPWQKRTKIQDKI
jgi:hypothetical protein